MQVTMLSGITSSFQRVMADHMAKAVTSVTINWRLEPNFSSSTVSVGPVLGDEPTIRFFGTDFAVEGDEYSGKVSSIDLFFPSSPYKAVRIDDVDIDLAELKIAAEDVSGVYDSDAFRGFLDLMMSEDGATITGTAGKDVIEGGLGADSLSGGKGKDVFILHENATDGGKDVIKGGKGFDQLTGFELENPIALNLLKGVLLYEVKDSFMKLAKLISIEGGFGTRFDDEMIGGDRDNKFFGYDGSDDLQSGGGNDRNFGGKGHDRIESGPGNDRNYGGKGNDDLYSGGGDDVNNGGGGDDFISSGAGDDLVFGDGGSDELAGGAGNDTLKGGFGSDTLFGGAGDDRLSGGAGRDTFSFSSQAGDSFEGHDVITDFNARKDVIEIFYDEKGKELTVTNNGTDTIIDHGNGTVTILGKVLSEDQISFSFGDDF